MLIKMSDWQIIRNNFLDEEKEDELNAAIVGEVLCPRGVIVDEEKSKEVCRRVRAMVEAPSFKAAYGNGNWPNICHKHNTTNKLKDCGGGYTTYICEKCEQESSKALADLVDARLRPSKE